MLRDATRLSSARRRLDSRWARPGRVVGCRPSPSTSQVRARPITRRHKLTNPCAIGRIRQSRQRQPKPEDDDTEQRRAHYQRVESGDGGERRNVRMPILATVERSVRRPLTGATANTETAPGSRARAAAARRPQHLRSRTGQCTTRATPRTQAARCIAAPPSPTPLSGLEKAVRDDGKAKQQHTAAEQASHRLHSRAQNRSPNQILNSSGAKAAPTIVIGKSVKIDMKDRLRKETRLTGAIGFRQGAEGRKHHRPKRHRHNHQFRNEFLRRGVVRDCRNRQHRADHQSIGDGDQRPNNIRDGHPQTRRREAREGAEDVGGRRRRSIGSARRLSRRKATATIARATTSTTIGATTERREWQRPRPGRDR